MKVKVLSVPSDVRPFKNHPAASLTFSGRSERSAAARTLTQRKMGKLYQVVVHGLRGEKMIIDLCNTEEQMQKMTVLQLKEKISQRLPLTAGEEALRLIFTDKNLEGDNTLLSVYGIQHMSVIHMVVKVPGGLIA